MKSSEAYGKGCLVIEADNFKVYPQMLISCHTSSSLYDCFLFFFLIIWFSSDRRLEKRIIFKYGAQNI